MSQSVCVHTDDKKYTNIEKLTSSDFSYSNIGEHKLKDNIIALNKKIWDSSEVVYWQMDSEYEHLTYKEQIDIIKLAFLETSLLTPLKIRQKRRQTGDAHIKINWLGAKDESFFKKRPSTLAFAYGPQKGIGGDCTMNADRLWLLTKEPINVAEAYEKGYITKYDTNHPNSTVKYYDPVHTMKHEVGGHSCGMKHLEDTDFKYTDIMYPYYNGKRTFGTHDKDYLFELYGKASYWKRVSRLIEHKMNRF